MASYPSSSNTVLHLRNLPFPLRDTFLTGGDFHPHSLIIHSLCYPLEARDTTHGLISTPLTLFCDQWILDPQSKR